MKRGQFNFVWIFAILAGGAILALAIYGAVRTGDTLEYRGDTEGAKSFSILTDPMQAGFADATYGKVVFQRETQLKNICLAGGFGKNEISITSRDDPDEEWSMHGGATSVHNKYIFSEEVSEGETYHVFSKGFEFPYKVSDLIFVMSDDYCFLNAWNWVVEDIEGLGVENIVFDNCSAGDTRVCFGAGADCDVLVYGDEEYGTVVKVDDEVNYVGSLIWGAIFSDKAVYDCNVERLIYRTKSIAEIFVDKAGLMDARDCGTNLRGKLVFWAEVLGEFDGTGLGDLQNKAEVLGKENDLESCGVW